MGKMRVYTGGEMVNGWKIIRQVINNSGTYFYLIENPDTGNQYEVSYSQLMKGVCDSKARVDTAHPEYLSLF